ncbi:MAG: winged helix-turn-helix transcriptional regulator [Bacteroidales bacterium]|nr:winged helix-turn-helix transcriptional regulator [Bacteroidales bacterium]
MSSELNLLDQLLPHIDSYVQNNKSVDLKLFSIYLKDKLFEIDTQTKSGLEESEYLDYKAIPQVEFSAILTRLYRFANRYLKQVFKDSHFKSIDEFGFLATLLKEGPLTKTELINKHLMEITTGVEIIKRLVKKGLIKESDDVTDKRSKIVILTNEGRKELFSAFNRMYEVSLLITGNLNPDELKGGIEMMTKLSDFHQTIFENDKNSELTQIYGKYLV